MSPIAFLCTKKIIEKWLFFFFYTHHLPRIWRLLEKREKHESESHADCCWNTWKETGKDYPRDAKTCPNLQNSRTWIGIWSCLYSATPCHFTGMKNKIFSKLVIDTKYLDAQSCVLSITICFLIVCGFPCSPEPRSINIWLQKCC